MDTGTTSPTQLIQRALADDSTSTEAVMRQLVEEGNLQITLIDALPGTCSTALERAMTECPEVDFQIHKPFYHSRDAGMRLMLQKLAEADKWPAHMLVKEMSNYLDKTCLPELADRHIVLFRNPLTQTFSYARRYIESHLKIDPYFMMRFAYDEQKHYRRLVHILNGELTREDLEGMDPEDVTEITKMIGKTRSKAKEILSDPGLEENGRIRGCDLSWAQLGQRMKSQNKGSKIALIDASALRTNPAEVIPILCEAVDLTFTPDSVGNWKKTNGAVRWSPDEFAHIDDQGRPVFHAEYMDPMIGRTLRSSGWNKQGEIVTWNLFPELDPLHEYVVDIALPVYLALLEDERLVALDYMPDTIHELLNNIEVFEDGSVKLHLPEEEWKPSSYEQDLASNIKLDI